MRTLSIIGTILCVVHCFPLCFSNQNVDSPFRPLGHASQCPNAGNMVILFGKPAAILLAVAIPLPC
jgi:hypothetical protein